MFLDLQTMFSGTVAADGTKTGQGITATAISTNVLDRSTGLAAGKFPVLEDEGISGPESWLIVQVQTSAAGGDAAKTLTITLESDTAATLAVAPVVHFSTPAITGATLVAGFTAVRVQLPSADYKPFIGLRYTVSAGFTSFNILAYLTMDPQRNVIYPTGFTIDV
jgi:hypothetical protein